MLERCSWIVLCSLTLHLDNFLVTASSSGDKIVVSSCKCKPVPLLELGEGVSEKTNKQKIT